MLLAGLVCGQSLTAYAQMVYSSRQARSCWSIGKVCSLFSSPVVSLDREFSFVRSLDANAGEQSGIRWRKWRFQSFAPDRWTALDPVGTKASILTKVTENGEPSGQLLFVSFAGHVLHTNPSLTSETARRHVPL